MAIKFKQKSSNGESALLKMGVPEKDVYGLSAAGVGVKLTVDALHFTQGEKLLVKVPVNVDMLMDLHAGKLKPTQKFELTSAVTKAMELALKQAAETYKVETLVPTAIIGPKGMSAVAKDATADAAVSHKTVSVQAGAGTLGLMPPIKKTEPAPAVWPEFDAGLLKSAPCVKLRDATMMYQPVFGTSAGSRYFLVGANKDLRIAARYISGSLSVRIEGPNWLKYKENIEKSGVDKVSSKKDYASVHLHCTDATMAAKALGAILLGLGVKLETPYPDISTVQKAS